MKIANRRIYVGDGSAVRSSVVFRRITRTTKNDEARRLLVSTRRRFVALASFRLYFRVSMRANSRSAETRVHVPRDPEIASAVDHAGEAGQAAVTKHRKSRRKKPKNAAGDTKVRLPHPQLSREFCSYIESKSKIQITFTLRLILSKLNSQGETWIGWFLPVIRLFLYLLRWKERRMRALNSEKRYTSLSSCRRCQPHRLTQRYKIRLIPLRPCDPDHSTPRTIIILHPRIPTFKYQVSNFIFQH